MNNELYMIVELKNGKLIEVYRLWDDDYEHFVAKDIIYKSLTEFFVNYLDYQPPKSVDSFVKNIEMYDSKNEVRVIMSQKRALYNFHVYCSHKDTDFNNFLQWAKECEMKERVEDEQTSTV